MLTRKQLIEIIHDHSVEVMEGEVENLADHILALIRPYLDELDVLKVVAKNFGIHGY